MASHTISVLAIAITVLLLVPFEPVFWPPEETSGWTTRIVADLAEGRRFGVDTVFGYGPLGVVPIRVYFPGTYGWLLAGSCAVATAFIVSSMALLAHSGFGRFQATALTLLAAGVATSQLHQVGTEPVFNLLIAFVPLLGFARGREPLGWAVALLLGFALAIAALGKFNYLIGAGGVIAVSTAVDLARRRVPYVGIAFGAAFLVLWTACGQRLGDLPAFLSGSIDYTRGYTDAMSLQSVAQDAVGFVLAAGLLLLAATATQAFLARTPEQVAALFGMAFFLSLVLKTAVVRQDEHVLSAAVTLVAAAIFITAIERKMGRRLKLATGTAVVLAITAWTISLASLGATTSEELVQPLRTIRAQASGFAQTLTDPSRLERQHRTNLASVKAHSDLPALEGTIDYMPNGSTMPWALGLMPRPNPVVMGYVGAYTPRLAMLQAEHLRGVNAPRNLVVRLDTIDNRFPSLDLGPSLLEILSSYAPAGRVKGAIVLLRQRELRTLQLEPIASVDLRPGEAIDLASLVPHSSMIWARIHVHRGMARSVASALYHSPSLRIRVVLRAGGEIEKRYVPGGGEAGFLVSPYLANTDSLEQMLRGELEPTNDVSSFSIDADATPLPAIQGLTVELFEVVPH
ncbi:MAG: hypothetical protein HYU52_00870 [Acidobacteria bacterium]|nr:hypothetical protein [Acidobacteriota bacterium]